MRIYVFIFVFALISLIGVLTPIYAIIKERRFVKVKAKVTSLSAETHTIAQGSVTTQTTHVSYEHQGVEYSDIRLPDNFGTPGLDSTITIKINPDNPIEIVKPQSYVVGVLVGLLFMIVTIWMIFNPDKLIFT